MESYNPSDLLLIAEDIYLAFKEGGKAVATTPHESAWKRLAVSLCFFSAFHASLRKLLSNEDFSREYQEKLSKGLNVFKFVIEESLDKYKLDELVDLYELWIKAFFDLNYEVSLEEMEKAIKITSNVLRLLKSS